MRMTVARAGETPCFPGLPKSGTEDIHDRCDGAVCLTSPTLPVCGGNQSQARAMVPLKREGRNVGGTDDR